MTHQEQEEMDFTPMSPYEFEAAAVQQEGHLRPAAQYLLTDYDTWVANPFWDGVTVADFNEEYPEEESATATVCPPQSAPPLEDDGLPF
jgi:hypothetical protein